MNYSASSKYKNKIKGKIMKINFLFISLIVLSLLSADSLKAQIFLGGNDLKNPPVILDQAGMTYVLTEDFTAPGTAFVIAGNGDNITLDLGGHTVVFGDSAGDYRYGILIAGVSYNSTIYPDIPSYVFTDGGANGTIIKNGTLKQGAAEGSNCVNIFGTGRVNITIENMELVTYGVDCRPIYFTYSNDLFIHDNVIYNHSKFVTNRHQGTAAIDLENAREGDVQIYNNKIIDSPQWGIRITRNRNYTAQGYYYVYNNDISMNTVVTNGYGIGAHADNMYVYGNNIHPINGRGIHMTRNNIKVYDNTIDVFEKGNNEYPYLFAHGIKLEFCTNCEIYNNHVTSHGRHDDTTYYVNPLTGEKRLTYGHGQALNISLAANSNCYIHDNYFLGIHDGGNLVSANHWADYAAACYITELEANSGLRMENNTFESNSVLFYVYWDMPEGGGDVTLKNSTFIRNTQPAGNQGFIETFHANNANYSNIVFLDPVQQGNVDLSNYEVLGTAKDFDYSVAWSITVHVKSDLYSGIPNATVEIYDKDSKLVNTLKTDSKGDAVFELKEFTIFRIGGQMSRLDYSPYTVKVTYGSASTQTTVVADSKKTVTLTLTGIRLDNLPQPGNVKGSR
jgi:hypothetical protein